MENLDKLRRLQLAELEILDEFIRICREHDLRYYLTGGSLLGAIRHRGFIPTDDDIDIAMPREDYDRFAQICRQGLAGRYFYQSPETDPHYFLSYAKLRMNGTEIYEERFRNSRFHKGIYIDLFPLDFCPRPGLWSHFLFNALAVMNYRGQVDSGETYVPYRELSGKLGYGALSVFPPRTLLRVRKRVLHAASRSGRAYLANFPGAYGYHKEIAPAEWYGEAQMHEFEDRMCRIPAEPEKLLLQLYGEDYMTVPKAETQTMHVELDKIRFFRAMD